MVKSDLILLHAPSVYDFRENIVMYGPISEHIPSTPIFEMYPIGFLSIVGHLRRNGYRVRIINLAAKMLIDPAFQPEELIKRLEPMAFGIDLHWLVHAHGSLEVARLVKRHHPDTPIILGGLSSTYYHREIANDFPEVDFILRGDSVEEPLLQLLRCIERGKPPENVPNLTWRDEDGRKHINQLTYVPETLDDFILNYRDIADLVIGHHDLKGNLPYRSWMDHPFTALLTCKGCLYDCINCGGSRSTFRNVYMRGKPAFKSPDRLVEEMKIIEEFIRAPVFLIGDLRQGGERYAREILNLIGEEGVDNPIIIELFTAAPKDYIKRVADSCSTFTLQISPESHDEEIRRLQGRPYTNNGLEKTIEHAVKFGCQRVDVFFMIGLPGQTYQSTMDTANYCRVLTQKYEKGGVVHPFIAPLAPFIDPGSPAFEKPAEYGYVRTLTTLAEHREALRKPLWKHFLNYQTRWMTRDEIVEASYDALYILNKVKRDYGLIDRVEAERMEGEISLARGLMSRIDEICASTTDLEEREQRLIRLREELDAINRPLPYLRDELIATCETKIKKSAVVKYLLRRAFRRSA
ncbi:MAG: TIGR04190 family B12-binding domain/radical SAM domain protein [Candidatus Geothermarchaeales archaeon]